MKKRVKTILILIILSVIALYLEFEVPGFDKFDAYLFAILFLITWGLSVITIQDAIYKPYEDRIKKQKERSNNINKNSISVDEHCIKLINVSDEYFQKLEKGGYLFEVEDGIIEYQLNKLSNKQKINVKLLTKDKLDCNKYLNLDEINIVKYNTKTYIVKDGFKNIND